MSLSKRIGLAILVLLLASTSLLAQDIPVRNWTVPVFDAEALKYGELRPFTHTQGNTPAIFVPYGPCRLTDSRVSSGGPGPIAGGGTRNYDFVPSGCGGNDVSEPILAWSLNFSVVNTAGPGFLYAYPTSGAPPPVSILNYSGAAGEIRNNAAILPVNAATGSFTVGAGVSATDVIIDTNGLFLAVLEDTTSFHVTGTAFSTGVIRGENTRLDANGIGVWGSHAGGGIGVYGSSVNGWGVYGTSVNGWGVHGVTVNDLGVFGYASSTTDQNFGVFGFSESAANGSNGVRGLANNGAGITYGVYGQTNSIFSDAAGVFGVGQGGLTAGTSGGFASAGVRGESHSATGVFGVTDDWEGVRGVVVNSMGIPIVAGVLGFNGLTDYGIFALGPYGGTGAKYFVEPHPSDASRVIRYVSLEGPESGTYFRGRGRFQNGLATIEVPEDFRMVTDSEGLTVQVTPIGEMATVGVLKMGLEEIVVRGSRDVEFSYMVNGVRRTHKHLTPIGPGREYMPESPDSKMPLYLTEGQKRMLISNGTYLPDGTVNLETARRLGWDRVWEQRRPAPQPPRENE